MLAAFALANLKHDIDAVFGWLSHRSFWQLMFMAAMLLAGWQYLGKRMEQRHAHKLQTQLSKAVQARLNDRSAYVKAQAAAHVQNIAQVQRIEAQQKRISDERLEDANDRLARMSDELRKHGPAAQSAPSAAGLPPVSKPPTGADGAPGLCLSPAQLLRAAQDEERHDQLITFLEQQSAIDPNK